MSEGGFSILLLIFTLVVFAFFVCGLAAMLGGVVQRARGEKERGNKLVKVGAICGAIGGSLIVAVVGWVKGSWFALVILVVSWIIVPIVCGKIVIKRGKIERDIEL